MPKAIDDIRAAVKGAGKPAEKPVDPKPAASADPSPEDTKPVDDAAHVLPGEKPGDEKAGEAPGAPTPVAAPAAPPPASVPPPPTPKTTDTPAETGGGRPADAEATRTDTLSVHELARRSSAFFT